MAATKLLVVDDNPTMRQIFALSLRTVGYEVVEAADGAETLAQAETERPDLILLDLSLPDSDGLELADRLRALPGAAHTPIVAVAGFLSKLEVAQIQQRFEDYLLKPVDPAELVRRVGLLAPPRKEEAPIASRPRVLLVDDSPTQLKLTRLHLEQAGYHVTTAANGAEALALFRAGTFDLVITDLAMPGLTGDRLAAAIKALAPHTPVILSSGFGDSVQAPAGRPLNVDARLDKPAKLDALRQVIAAVTRAAPPRA